MGGASFENINKRFENNKNKEAERLRTVKGE